MQADKQRSRRIRPRIKLEYGLILSHVAVALLAALTTAGLWAVQSADQPFPPARGLAVVVIALVVGQGLLLGQKIPITLDLPPVNGIGAGFQRFKGQAGRFDLLKADMGSSAQHTVNATGNGQYKCRLFHLTLYDHLGLITCRAPALDALLGTDTVNCLDRSPKAGLQIPATQYMFHKGTNSDIKGWFRRQFWTFDDYAGGD